MYSLKHFFSRTHANLLRIQIEIIAIKETLGQCHSEVCIFFCLRMFTLN